MEKEKRISPAYLLLCLGAAVLLTALALRPGVSTDAAYSLALLRRGFGDIWRISAAGENPPLYYFAAKLFSMPFGYGELAVRLFSGLCCLLVAAIGGWEITRFWGRKMGLTFMILFPLYPFVTDYAAEPGVYALSALTVFLTALFACRVWKSNLAGDWVGLGVSGVCAAYCHHFALIAAAMINLLLLLCALVRGRKLLKGWLITAAASVLLYIPWMRNLVRQLSAAQGAPITAQGLLEDAIALLHAGGNVTFPLFLGLLLALIAVGAILRRQLTPLLAGAICVLTAGAGIALSVLVQPVFSARCLLPCAPLVVFFLSWGVCALRREAIFGGVIGFLLVGFAGNLVYGFLPVPVAENEFGRETVEAYSEVQACVVLTEDALELQQIAAYYLPDTPIYAEETLGDANPYPNVHPMEEFSSADWDTVLAFSDSGSRPIGGFPRNFQPDLIGTRQAEGMEFDLWLLKKQSAEEKADD